MQCKYVVWHCVVQDLLHFRSCTTTTLHSPLVRIETPGKSRPIEKEVGIVYILVYTLYAQVGVPWLPYVPAGKMPHHSCSVNVVVQKQNPNSVRGVFCWVCLFIWLGLVLWDIEYRNCVMSGPMCSTSIFSIFSSYIFCYPVSQFEIPVTETSLFPHPCSQFARDINLFKIAALPPQRIYLCDTITTKINTQIATDWIHIFFTL